MSRIDLLEGLMLISFSASWYWSIAKMLQTRTATGKSLNFNLMVCVGYGFGIGAKLIAWQTSGLLSPMIWVYSWNVAVTGADAALVLYFSRPRYPVVAIEAAEGAETVLARD